MSKTEAFAKGARINSRQVLFVIIDNVVRRLVSSQSVSPMSQEIGG